MKVTSIDVFAIVSGNHSCRIRNQYRCRGCAAARLPSDRACCSHGGRHSCQRSSCLVGMGATPSAFSMSSYACSRRCRSTWAPRASQEARITIQVRAKPDRIVDHVDPPTVAPCMITIRVVDRGLEARLLVQPGHHVELVVREGRRVFPPTLSSTTTRRPLRRDDRP